jgi:hypothetical protein
MSDIVRILSELQRPTQELLTVIEIEDTEGFDYFGILRILTEQTFWSSMKEGDILFDWRVKEIPFTKFAVNDNRFFKVSRGHIEQVGMLDFNSHFGKHNRFIVLNALPLFESFCQTKKPIEYIGKRFHIHTAANARNSYMICVES